ncbi:MAG: S8 family serine peptidase [Burkholderiales bacterium]|nr:S8 family serine peptidase [Burkholderiales bacterium]
MSAAFRSLSLADEPLAKVGRPDPYLEWAELTHFGGHAGAARRGAAAPIRVIIEFNKGQLATLRQSGLVQIPGLYGSALPGACFCSGVVRRDQLAKLAALPEVKRLSLSLPVDAGSIDMEPHRGSPLEAQNGRLVIGVIDRGCAWLNRAFRQRWSGPGSRHTRLRAFWDQGHAAAGPMWRRPVGFGYGRGLDDGAIDALIRRVDAGADEEAVYRDMDYLVSPTTRLPEHLHGTHVLDTFGGLTPAKPTRESAKPNHRSACGGAPLIFVNVPELSARDTTGASTDAYILDAIHFILDRAGPGARVVINLSIGAQAGPHDGSSCIESAIDELLDHGQDIMIVTAGGNGRQSRWSATGQLPKEKPGQHTKLLWRTLPGDVTDSFLEVWLRPAVPDGKLNGVQIRVTSPLGLSSKWITLGEQAQLADAGGGVQACLFALPQSALGEDAVALLALAPSDMSAANAPSTDTRRAAPAGRWMLALRNGSSCAVNFDAWVQRDEPPDGLAVAVQSRLEDAVRATIDGGSMVSSLSSARNVIAVGATRLDGRASPYTAFSGQALQRRATANVSAMAPADTSSIAFGLWAAGVRSGTLFRMSGTSVAAPVLARKLADWMVRQPAGTASKTLRKNFLGSLQRRPVVLPPPDPPIGSPPPIGKPANPRKPVISALPTVTF